LLRAAVTTSIDSFVVVPPHKAYEDFIQEAAVVHDVDPRLIRSVMQMESAFNPFAVSRAGALGLMQLMPELATELDVADPFDPRENIMAGTQYLRRLLDQYNGNVTLTLASYNAGATNVARYGGVPPFEETQNYVVGVRNLLRRR
jgi:soluble lytic murein transglycosylase-like protein